MDILLFDYIYHIIQPTQIQHCQTPEIQKIRLMNDLLKYSFWMFQILFSNFILLSYHLILDEVTEFTSKEAIS